MRKCDVCGLPSDILVKGRCAACIISERGKASRFGRILRTLPMERLKALATSILVAMVGWTLMNIPSIIDLGIFVNSALWGLGVFLLAIGVITLPFTILLGRLDW